MTTQREHSVIPLHKSVCIVCRSLANGPNVLERRYVSEASVVKFDCLVTALDGNVWWEIIQISGTDDDHQTQIYASPTVYTATGKPEIITIAVQGTFLVRMHYSNTVSLDINASGLLVRPLDETDAAADIATIAENQYRQEHIVLMKDLREYLIKINNNLRLITGARKDEAEEF